MTHNILRITVILCGLLSFPSVILAQDYTIVEAQTGKCNTIIIENENGTTTEISQCNNNTARENNSDIQKKLSSAKSKIDSEKINNASNKNNN